jgi:hypothetical protein
MVYHRVRSRVQSKVGLQAMRHDGDLVLTTRSEDCASGVEFVAELIERVGGEPGLWKWVILALDNTLQNFLIATVRHSSGHNIVEYRKKQQRLGFAAAIRLHDEQGGPIPAPSDRLLDFFDLWDAAQSDSMLRFVSSKRLEPTARQEECVRWLHAQRSAFSHPTLDGWSVHVSDAAECVGQCVEVIEFLGFASANMLWHGGEEQAERTSAAIKRLRQACDHLSRAS